MQGPGGGDGGVELAIPAGRALPSRGGSCFSDPAAIGGDLVNHGCRSPPNADMRPPTACLQVPAKVSVGRYGVGVEEVMLTGSRGSPGQSVEEVMDVVMDVVNVVDVADARAKRRGVGAEGGGD